MKTTKTGLRQRITVPSEVMDVLRWHTQTQLLTLEQRESDLLFPEEDGGFRSDRFLTKAFAAAGQLTGVKKKFTPRGMRRTFNDLARLANVEAVVTKSISGHKTERMREHYSSVQPSEQRESIGRLLRLVKPPVPASGHRDKGCSEGRSESPMRIPSDPGTRSERTRGRSPSFGAKRRAQSGLVLGHLGCDGLLLPHRSAAQRDQVRVVDEAVADRVGDRGLSDCLMPSFDRQLGRQDRRGLVVATSAYGTL
jgi:hypothetical protein